MAKVQVLSTHHTSFTVTDVDRSVAFFVDVLGFTLVHTEHASSSLVAGLSGVPGADARLAFVAGPGHTIELVEYLAPLQRGRVVCRPCDTGSSHIAFVVADAEAASRVTQAAGLTLLGTVQTVAEGDGAGAKSVYLRDPDGIQFEFIQMPPVSPA